MSNPIKNPFSGKWLEKGVVFFIDIIKIAILGEEDNFLGIYYIGRRSDIYEQFRHLLAELQKPSPLV